MIKKLIVIGIDGLDYDVVLKYREAVPNLYSMMERSGFARLRSVFPADTTPAWSTIFTGLDPSEHGIINFVNIKDRENKYKPLSFDDSAFYGKTFWDVLNRKGYSCAVLFPMNIKVGWPIDGLMVTRPYEGRVRVYPESKANCYRPDVNLLANEAKFTSEKHLDVLRDEFFAKAKEEFRITKSVIAAEDCDLLFTYFSTVDGIQHDFWRHCDESHPEYPGENPYRNVIRDMYATMDGYIGEIQRLCPDTPILVISDHGHGARPVTLVRINEMLKRAGFLTPKAGTGGGQKTAGAVERVKKGALSFVKQHGLPQWAVKLAKRFPVWKGLFASGNDFDWDNTKAYLSDLSALKNYSYGGIRVTGNGPERERLSEAVIDCLKDIRIEGTDTPLFTWIRRTDTLYHGAYLDRYPEIIFQMEEHYGAEWSLGEKLFEQQGFMHRLSPGAHRYETAVIAASGLALDRSQYELTDLFPLMIQAVSGEQA